MIYYIPKIKVLLIFISYCGDQYIEHHNPKISNYDYNPGTFPMIQTLYMLPGPDIQQTLPNDLPIILPPSHRLLLKAIFQLLIFKI